MKDSKYIKSPTPLMNPFDLNTTFNSFIYENISLLNSGNDKQVVNAFKQLLDYDQSLPLDNAMIYTAMKKHLASCNLIIRNLACDLLYKFHVEGDTSDTLNELTAIWLFNFIENPNYKTGNTIYQNYLNFEKVENHFLNLLDFKTSTISSLNGFLFALKKSTNDKKSLKKYKEWFIERSLSFEYNSNVILMKIYHILEYIGPIEEVYNIILLISAPSLINNKWNILYNIYNKVPNEINRDAKYIKPALLKTIVDSMVSTDELEVKSNENLYVILPKTKNKEEYVVKNLLNVRIKEINYKKLGVNLSFLDKHFELSVVNGIIRYTLSDFVVKFLSLNLKLIRFIESDSILCNLIDLDRLKLKISPDKEMANLSLDEENERQSLEFEIKKDVFLSLKKIGHEMIIKRSAFLGIHLKVDQFEWKVVVENLAESLEVFDKTTFLNKKVEFDNTLVIIKYPEEFDDETVERVLKKDFVPFIGIKRFYKSVIRQLDLLNLNDLDEIRNLNNFTKEYDLFFYYRFREGDIRFINYNELLSMFLNASFIKNLFSHEDFDRTLFYDEVCNFLRDYNVPITTEYSNSYYDGIPDFFKNVVVKKKLFDLEELRNVYVSKAETSEEKLILLVINEILNRRDYECLIEENVKLNLGKNQFFVDKVYIDLGILSATESTNTVDLLQVNEKRTIDYCIRNNSFDIVDLRFIDFSFLSTEALNITVARLCEYLEDDSENSYHSFEDSNDSNLSLKNYITKNENSNQPTLNDIIGLMERDKLLLGDFYNERFIIFKPLVNIICSELSNNMINNFSLAKAESDIDEMELYDFIVSGFPTNPILFWILLLDSISQIRNIDLIIFIQKMLNKRNLKEEFNYLDINYKKVFAFTFPNLYVNITNTKLDLEELIYKEASTKIENISVKMNKTSTDYALKIIYLNQSDEFISYVRIPFDYPFKRSTFSTNVEKNSLLNVKVGELIRKSSKFMSVINLWKINIDKKVDGAKECLFCYFIIHTTDGTFPDYGCIHCGNKFHNRCIERWTKSYNKRTCPLCRQPIPIY